MSLFGDLDVDVAHDVPIGGQTWYGIGGRADLVIHPHTIEALATLCKRCWRSRTPLRVLGSGANLLVADEGVDGIVVKLDHPTFKAISYDTATDSPMLSVAAGADMARTLMDTARRGYESLSQMAGIPATIGGALRMNAGGAYGNIGQAVRSVTCITQQGEVVTYPRDQLIFQYRKSNIPDPIIVSASFDITPDDPIELRQRIKDIFAFKKSTQPLADHSAGCTFRNPFDPETEQYIPAGKLIDDAGLKGTRQGGAVVSEQHANFIVTEAGATASDVMQLLRTMQSIVLDRTGIQLEPEIIIWRRGDDLDDAEESSGTSSANTLSV